MLVVKDNVSQVSPPLHTTSKHRGKTYHTQNFLAGWQKCSCFSVTQDGRRWPPQTIAALSQLTTGATISAGSRRGSCRCLCGYRETKPTRPCCESCTQRRLESSQPFHVRHIPPSPPAAWVEGKKRLQGCHWGTSDVKHITHLNSISSPHRATHSCTAVTLLSTFYLLTNFQSDLREHTSTPIPGSSEQNQGRSPIKETCSQGTSQQYSPSCSNSS